MNARGASLIETVAALAILGIALAAAVPAFMLQMDTNTFAEHHSGAVAAAQQVMETLRNQDPASLPSSGSSAIQAVTVGHHEYEAVTHYCQRSVYCGSDSRHIVIEVSFAGQMVYTIETVFTRLH